MEKSELIGWITAGLQNLGYPQNIRPNRDSVSFEINPAHNERIDEVYTAFANEIKKRFNGEYSLVYAIKDSLNPDSSTRVFTLEEKAR